MNSCAAADTSLVYRAPASTRMLGVLLGSVLVFTGIASAILMLLDLRAADAGDTAWLAMLGTFTLGAGVATLITTLRYQLSLLPQSLVLRSAWKTEVMQRSDIAGYRTMGEYGGDILIFISRRGPAHGVAVKMSFKTDAAFVEWMTGIPNV